MKIQIIGLGKMGLNLALNAKDNGHEIMGYDVSEKACSYAKENGIQVAASLGKLTTYFDHYRIILLSLPSGRSTNDQIQELVQNYLSEGDIVIDSGNSKYTDSLGNYDICKKKGVGFLDCGTSGGTFGARHGACLMVGGEQSVYKKVEPFFQNIACEGGCLYTGMPGSGHFLKMVHNGIEYGMMQALGEGFELLASSSFEYDYEKVACVWNHGSVIRSWLCELAEKGFAKDKELESLQGVVDSSGEAKWAVEEALLLNIPVPVIASSLFVRNSSKIDNSFSNRVVAMLRHEFGGHEVRSRGIAGDENEKL